MSSAGRTAVDDKLRRDAAVCDDSSLRHGSRILILSCMHWLGDDTVFTGRITAQLPDVRAGLHLKSITHSSVPARQHAVHDGSVTEVGCGHRRAMRSNEGSTPLLLLSRRTQCSTTRLRTPLRCKSRVSAYCTICTFRSTRGSFTSASRAFWLQDLRSCSVSQSPPAVSAMRIPNIEKAPAGENSIAMNPGA
jgi:hypothetical protein